MMNNKRFTFCCNILKCRAQLIEKAVITTCNHIFCETCGAQHLQIQQNSRTRQCPACGEDLKSQDDVVLTVLSPTEDYKNSILSGLSPEIMLKCVEKGLDFYSYQMCQEMLMTHSIVHSNENSDTTVELINSA